MIYKEIRNHVRSSVHADGGKKLLLTIGRTEREDTSKEVVGVKGYEVEAANPTSGSRQLHV